MASLKGVKTLDMVGGEITKVAYEGSEYERVEGGAKVGDLVHLAEVGSFYKCYDVDFEGDAFFAFGIALNRSKYELFRKKHVRLKVGDYAKVVEDDGRWDVSKGDLVKVSDDDRTMRPFHCDILRGEFAGQLTWLRESDLVLATEAEVAAAKESEEKRSIEAKWAKIGRKVGEYKAGDIVAYDDPAYFKNDGIGEVTADSTYDCGPEIKAIGRSGYQECRYVRKSSLTLITPVEARFDRS
ncbi:hypothetical protein IHP72_15340 [Bacillus pumilus]|uniref:hypothetical protein n=1 Tax=Bacillus pumilus TaxID=1408 RepID=UPI001B39D006|nr:hypothetical protein [Bacillus pumilus]MBQ4817628.1 hypothetical protein [Bacillus pumilus]